MKVYQQHISYRPGDVFRIWGIGDVHLGGAQFARKELLKTIEKIQQGENDYWVGLGDLGDYVNWQDTKRFEPSGFEKNRKVRDLGNLHEIYVKELAEVFGPIKGKCLGLVDGNHEFEYARRHSVVITTLLASKLGTRVLDYSCAFRLIFSRDKDMKHHSSSLRFYLFHGSGGGAMKGGKALRLSRYFLSYPWADVVFSAHQHDRVAITEDYADVTWPIDDSRSGSFTEKRRIAMMVGSFRHTISAPGDSANYAERKGHSIVAPGAVWVTYDPQEQELHGVI